MRNPRQAPLNERQTAAQMATRATKIAQKISKPKQKRSAVPFNTRFIRNDGNGKPQDMSHTHDGERTRRREARERKSGI